MLIFLIIGIYAQWLVMTSYSHQSSIRVCYLDLFEKCCGDSAHRKQIEMVLEKLYILAPNNDARNLLNGID